MTSDLDIYRAAQALIKQHGEDATIHAAMRASEPLAPGDMEGRAVWIGIVRAAKELLDERPPGDGEAVH
ncbi:MAG: hypothetical protein V3U18_01355 [Alphaproteobacteria bacterium]